MPESGEYNRTIGTTTIIYSGKKTKAFSVEEARAALGTGDFELADPALEEISLPLDFPFFEQLTKNGKYKDLESVRAAADEELLEISGIGKASLEKIRAYQPPAASGETGNGETAASNQTATVGNQVVSTSSTSAAGGEGVI